MHVVFTSRRQSAICTQAGGINHEQLQEEILDGFWDNPNPDHQARRNRHPTRRMSRPAGLQQICKHAALSLVAVSYTRLCIMQSRLRALIGPETAAICDLVPPVRTTPCHQYSDQGVRHICKKVNLTTNITPSARLTIHFYGETLLCIILNQHHLRAMNSI